MVRSDRRLKRITRFATTDCRNPLHQIDRAALGAFPQCGIRRVTVAPFHSSGFANTTKHRSKRVDALLDQTGATSGSLSLLVPPAVGFPTPAPRWQPRVASSSRHATPLLMFFPNTTGCVTSYSFPQAPRGKSALRPQGCCECRGPSLRIGKLKVSLIHGQLLSGVDSLLHAQSPISPCQRCQFTA